MNRKKGDSDVERLAKFFVMDFLGRDGIDYRRDGRHLKHAKMLLKPTEKDGYAPKSYSVDQVITCLQAMVGGAFGDWEGTPETMLAVMWHEPPFIERMNDIEKYLPPRPPFYMKTELKEWNLKYAHLVK